MNDQNSLVTEVRDSVGMITFNRPRQRNALTPRMLLSLGKTLEEWASADRIRAIVITGMGNEAFSAGFDITAIPTEGDPELQRKLKERDPLATALHALKEFPYPTIAMINGQCFGGALNLALCCDLRVGVNDMVIAMPPAKLGIVYPANGIAQFVNVLGMANTRDLFFTARAYNGKEALDLGIVQRLVGRKALEEVSLDLANTIAANAPLALKGIKRTLNLLESNGQLTASARDEVDQLVARAMQSADAQEAKQAFFEKRAPKFTGN